MIKIYNYGEVSNEEILKINNDGEKCLVNVYRFNNTVLV